MIARGDSFDVLIVGGGPAGLAAAIAARQKRFDVAVIDGIAPPIDKACGEGMMPETLAVLNELGVKFAPGDGHHFRGISFVQDDAAVVADFPHGHAIGLRRPALHERLFARAKNVECITGDGLRMAFRQSFALADAMLADDLTLYQRAHRELARRPMLMGNLLLWLGRHPRIRSRILRAMQQRPELFARILATHVGDATPAQLHSAGASLGWQFLAARHTAISIVKDGWVRTSPASFCL